MFFDKYPEFVDLDIRNSRPNLTITVESLSNRCEAIFSKLNLEGSSILDLGSALGAMGHYALVNGAKSYTGVEIQKPYRDTSATLLAKYHQNWNIVSSIKEIDSTYDIVLACGIVHSFIDIFGILKKVCSLSSSVVIIETNNPKLMDSPMIAFTKDAPMVSTKDVPIPRYSGLAALPNKGAVDLIMLLNSFVEECRIYPKPILGSIDGYNNPNVPQHRFISKYVKTEHIVPTLESTIYDDNMDF